MERPLCVVSDLEKSDGVEIYANREGLLKLKDAIDKVLNGEKQAKLNAWREADGWHPITVNLSDQGSFETGEGVCNCGCQDKFKKVEQDWMNEAKATLTCVTTRYHIEKVVEPRRTCS